MRPAEVVALATDFDRTLTDDALQVSDAALGALREARRAGLLVIVVSGRDPRFLEGAVGDAADLFVGENGCLLKRPGKPVVATCTDAPDLRRALAGAPFEVEHHAHLASADVAREPALRALLAAAHVQADLIRNRDRVMVLPRGIDKAAGLLRALDLLGVPPERCAAAGDAENDLAMLRAVGYRIAVANAIDELKTLAHHVTRRPGGDGLSDWVRDAWLPARRRVVRA